MDSLGGILIKGLLGNLILARLNLFFEIIIEDVTPTPTPTVTPTVTPTPSAAVGGGGGRSSSIDGIDDTVRTVRITIKYKDKEYSSNHRMTEKMLRVTINTINRINKVKEKVTNISVKLKKKDTTVKVKLHDD